MRVASVLALLLLAGCGKDAARQPDDSPGGRIERAARANGLVSDPSQATLVGSWARDTDRLCIVPGKARQYRIGAVVDYGEGQGCTASGTATRTRAGLDIAFGNCRIEAVFDGERINFPPEVTDVCSRACIGRASLAALSVDRVSESIAEASTLRSASGTSLCVG